ncbi:MAG: hypothetical protein JO316_09155 [Abitibacteriaceae bacterium]|nr:hypothetical protein [Abditibacteriaceae bacterium]
MNRISRSLISGIIFNLCALAAVVPQSAAAAMSKKPAKKATLPVIVQGKVVSLTRVPRLGSALYKDAVIAVHLEGLKAMQGKFSKSQIVVYTWGLHNARLAPAAMGRPGQMMRFQLTPWHKAENKYGGYNRINFQDDGVMTLSTYWGDKK